MISLEDPVVRRRAAEAVERSGWTELTLDELGRALGVSRVTLYRQGIAKADILAALRDHLANAYRDALWPALTDSGPAPGVAAAAAARAHTHTHTHGIVMME